MKPKTSLQGLQPLLDATVELRTRDGAPPALLVEDRVRWHTLLIAPSGRYETTLPVQTYE